MPITCYRCGSWPCGCDDQLTVLHGDCVKLMAELPESSVSAIVCDPPYALVQASRGGSSQPGDLDTPYGRSGPSKARRGFMGKEWDTGEVAFDPATWVAALRVAKPGAMLLAFGGTRTHHRLMAAIEDAGWEIRDCLMWVYGSGFPKSLAIDKAIDRQRYERDDILRVTKWIREARDNAGKTNADLDAAFGFAGMAGHWTSSKSQPAVPTLDQVPTILDVMGVALDDVPEEMRRLIWTLNGNKGQPGAAWYEREKVGQRTTGIGTGRGTTPVMGDGNRDITAPATEAAKTWDGYGTALKPAYEPIILAMAPLDGTFAENAQKWGVAGINIDGCRVGTGTGEQSVVTYPNISGTGIISGHGNKRDAGETVERTITDKGRFPANLIHDGSEEVVAGFPETTGHVGGNNDPNGSMGYHGGATGKASPGVKDSGSAARYFYCAKADKSERGDSRHPTIKPRKLMEYLCKLVKMPAPNLILDPFAGSGTTLEAARNLGMAAIGIEQSKKSCDDTVKRLESGGLF